MTEAKVSQIFAHMNVKAPARVLAREARLDNTSTRATTRFRTATTMPLREQTFAALCSGVGLHLAFDSPTVAHDPPIASRHLPLAAQLMTPQARDALIALREKALDCPNLASDNTLAALNASPVPIPVEVQSTRTAALQEHLSSQGLVGILRRTQPHSDVLLAILNAKTPGAVEEDLETDEDDKVEADLSAAGHSDGVPAIPNASPVSMNTQPARRPESQNLDGFLAVRDTFPVDVQPTPTSALEGLLGPQALDVLAAIVHGTRRVLPHSDALLAILNARDSAAIEEDVETGDAYEDEDDDGASLFCEADAELANPDNWPESFDSSDESDADEMPADVFPSWSMHRQSWNPRPDAFRRALYDAIHRRVAEEHTWELESRARGEEVRRRRPRFDPFAMTPDTPNDASPSPRIYPLVSLSRAPRRSLSPPALTRASSTSSDASSLFEFDETDNTKACGDFVHRFDVVGIW
ncbi:hypothetical protein C8R47DRAFT_759475 [Mycena vitilis]|nr:hypothetical protein C8R47DRAFT_759475 [Mycena vitilis]